MNFFEIIKKKSDGISRGFGFLPQNFSRSVATGVIQFCEFSGEKLRVIWNFQGWSKKPRNSRVFFKKLCPQSPQFFFSGRAYFLKYSKSPGEKLSGFVRWSLHLEPKNLNKIWGRNILWLPVKLASLGWTPVSDTVEHWCCWVPMTSCTWGVAGIDSLNFLRREMWENIHIKKIS